MRESIPVEPAQPEEVAAAFRLIFQHLAARERELRVANAVALVRSRELDPEGVVVVRGTPGLRGAMVSLPVAGASGLVWPPRAVAGGDEQDIEDRLVAHSCAWLRQRGARLAQTLLPAIELPLAAPLTRNGFCHTTRLWYMHHDLAAPPPMSTANVRLTHEPYASCDPHLFHETLLRTYEGTLDCPEVTGVRDIDEIIQGHRAQGVHDPNRWWLTFREGRPAGVLLLAQMTEWPGWDLSYVGVVPEARGQGVGRELTLKALYEARAEGAAQLTLAVDQRNQPAWHLYRSLGFREYDQREVLLAIW
jgi:ribosomal protein S18 acetylase RimI-like enzyme